ncbi:MAG TPA: SGNH/GDSL hydrolase family protein [Marmoricola sp.]|nr:SGNH/GDSL hydrolase family protein [Marmoricola sp.]
MRSPRTLLSLAAGLVAVATAVIVPVSQSGAVTPHYYVSLGDSLSRGYMPGAGDTNQGYADVLYARLKLSDPSLQLVKLGCSGETTTTMIEGGKCTDRYPVGTSQLDVAEQFLKDHHGQVTHLTIDIGANDVAGCAEGGSIDYTCVAQGTTTITANLQTILDGITAADGKLPKSIGMNYYDPFLASWLGGTSGQLVAAASVTLLVAINAIETLEYGEHGFRTADVATAFHTSDFGHKRFVAGYGTLPLNVAYICQYTYMCSQDNIHPTAQGYRIIANAFAARL